MMDKAITPSDEEMTVRCGSMAEYFASINNWLTATIGTDRKTVFPYGSKYSWGIGHYKRK